LTQFIFFLSLGCGPVGAGFACALSSSPYFSKNSSDDKKILILDSFAPPVKEKVSALETPDQRVYSISGSS